MSIGKFLNKTSVKLKEVSPGLMTALSIGGLIGTMALTVKATLDVKKKYDELEVEPTVIETAQLAMKPFAPVLAAGLGTSIMMIGSHRMSKMQIATLTAGYAALSKNYKTYVKKAEQLFGEDGCKKIREAIVRDSARKAEVVKPSDDDKMLYFDVYRDEFYEKTELEILQAEYTINRKLARNGSVSLNEFYDALDLKPIDEGDELGWGYGVMLDLDSMDGEDGVWIEFSHEMFDLEDGMQAINIVFPYPPVPGYVD